MEFKNRKSELARLERDYKNPGASFAVIYGRRRVGKTRLIEEFIKNKEAIYYLAADEKEPLQIDEFKQIIANFLKDEFMLNTRFDSWKSLFSYLKNVWPKQKIVFAIDEATYIIKNNPSFPSYLQQFWDQFLSKTNTMLILSGSLVGLMLSEVLEYTSPLYGRRTSDILLREFDFKLASELMASFSIEEQIKLYSLVGGVAKYLEIINKRKFDRLLADEFFDKNGFFYREALFILSQEFKDISTYINILKAIAFGNTKLNDLANFSGIESKKVTAYLDILINLGLIKREVPVTEDEKRFRGAIYELNDNFLTFWHRFVHPHRSEIELGGGSQVRADLKNSINSYVGRAFEDICRQSLIGFDKIGKWWGHYRDAGGRKELEIDIVGLKDKEILFGECKWKDNVDAETIVNELKEKAEHVKWFNGERKEAYAVFAKSFSKRAKGVYCCDLNDLAKALRDKTKMD